MQTAATTAPEAQTIINLRDDCRLCGQTNLTLVWSFGSTPLANSYLLPSEIGTPEVFAPLEVYYCPDCHLMQLKDVVHPDLLFRNYLYVSSTSPSFVAHFADYARTLIKKFSLTAADLVVDIGSNDGVLLRPLQAAGVQTLGIDPAQNIAAEASAAGITTLPEYFTPAVARQVRQKYGAAKVITANNVFAHTDDIHTFVAAVDELLAADGVFVFEVQYLATLVRDNLFDIVYHEHANYYHLTPLVAYFASKDMVVFDVEQPAVHGGSLRVYVCRASASHAAANAGNQRVAKLLAQEEQQGLNTITVYQEFSDRIAHNKQKLRQIIDTAKAAGKTIVGFGAPAKATTLMYAFGLTNADLTFIVDDAPLKQGRVMPGTHIPIVPADALYEKQPTFAHPSGETTVGTPELCIILAWNFADTIIKNHPKFSQRGGKWIVPTPEPRVL